MVAGVVGVQILCGTARARRKWLNLHDQRATKPYRMREASFQVFVSEPRAQQC